MRVSKASEIAWMVNNVGFSTPRSIPLKKALSTLALAAKASWDSLRFSRSFRTRCPNCFAISWRTRLPSVAGINNYCCRLKATDDLTAAMRNEKIAASDLRAFKRPPIF